MMAGIRDILVITTPHDADGFERVLGDGSQFGIDISYAPQDQPDGLAQAFVVGAKYIGEDSVALVLGDNIFYGPGWYHVGRFQSSAAERFSRTGWPTRSAYGVVEFATRRYGAGRWRRSPATPKSSHTRYRAWYFYDNE